MAPFSPESVPRLAAILDKALADLQTTQTLDVASWQARYPDLAEELAPLLQTLHDVDTALSDWKAGPADATISEAPDALPGAGPPPPTNTVPYQVGRYLIQEHL